MLRRSVAQEQEPAVLDLMLAVPARLLFVPNGDIVNVKLINLEVLNVVLALMTCLHKTKKVSIKLVQIPSVILDLIITTNSLTKVAKWLIMI